MNRKILYAVAAAVAIPTLAVADPVEAPKRGDHPAVVVQRLQQQAGYDYASKFYPHPAWLYLYNESPDVLAERAAAKRVAHAPAAAAEPQKR